MGGRCRMRDPKNMVPGQAVPGPLPGFSPGVLTMSLNAFRALPLRLAPVLLALASFLIAPAARASEADLVLPDFSSVSFMGITGFNLLLVGMGICLAGMGFGLAIFMQLRALPVHKS